MPVIDTYTVDSSGKATIKKDPQAVLDYTFNWSAYLAPISDTISTVTWVVPQTLDSISVVSSSFNTTSATAFVSGGNLGTTEQLTCRITTAGGRTDDRSVFLKIVQR